MNQEQTYNIPLRFRIMENLHIVFWLFKDVSWCMVWKPLGIIMVIPTLVISIVIAWQNRKMVSELSHNLAISLWITANSMWMISEFFHYDEKIFFGFITGKQLSMFPFSLGIIILMYYYLWFRWRNKTQVETM